MERMENDFSNFVTSYVARQELKKHLKKYLFTYPIAQNTDQKSQLLENASVCLEGGMSREDHLIL